MTRLLLISLSAMALCAAPQVLRADANPDFDDNAKPILRMQPGLLEYVESQFEVKDRGTAKYPGDDDHDARPPYIFRARPRGSSGPYNLRLLIQPGPVGHILGVVDITKVDGTQPHNPPAPQQPSQPAFQQQQPPAVVSQQPSTPPQNTSPYPVQNSPTTAQAPAQPAQQHPNEPTSDTPSGPITGSGTQAQPLAPPPDSTQYPAH